MWRAIAGIVLALVLSAQSVWAITYDEIPDDVRRRLPEMVLRLVDPAALAALTVDDLREFADAYEEGRLRFVADVQVEAASGPLKPELAILLLQVPRGAPYVESRFVRLAKQAYGRGIFSSLEWAAYPNQDGSVDIHLWYSSRRSSFWAPDGSYDALAGWLAGVRYEDLYYGGENKQLKAAVMFNEEYTDEVNVRASWADNTLNGGHSGYSVAASLRSDWRRRMKFTTNQVNLRQRVARLDTGYSWFGQRLGELDGSLTLGAGVYDQDHFVIAVSEELEEGLPRTDFDQAGTAGYLSLAFSSSESDMSFTPRDGHFYQLKADGHGGAFDFSRLTIDLRRYVPAPNILGYVPPPVCDGERMNIRHQFPTASLAFQLQARMADGDVPYSEEVRIGRSDVARGLPWDQYVGTKLVAGRAEYRFNIDRSGESELFVFCDHAAVGETFDDLESFHTYGIGGVFKVPIYGGIKLGAYYGGSFDHEDSGYGLVFGYQF